jgi:hypothetical protein
MVIIIIQANKQRFNSAVIFNLTAARIYQPAGSYRDTDFTESTLFIVKISVFDLNQSSQLQIIFR